MRPRILLILAAVAGVVIVICELESVAATNRWDPADVGRSSALSLYLWPKEVDNLPPDEHALITVRVETVGAVRTYRYQIMPCEEEPDDLLTLEKMDESEETALTADELDPGAAGAEG